MRLKFRLLLMVVIVSSLFPIAEGAWQGPAEIISGTWGQNNDQFGIKYGDTNDVFAGPIYILADGNIVIQDVINGRYKVYSADGTLQKALKCVEVSPDVYNEECNFDGDYLQTTSDGNMWVDQSKYKQPKYSLYSPTGQLIKTSTTKPLELGVVKSTKLGENNYKITVTYPDKVYGLSADRKFTRYVRDTSGFVYGINAGGVWRFNQCGKLTGTVLMPSSQIQETPRPGGGENIITVQAEYGHPVVAPNGDVYTWKRAGKYSILKWTWADDPNVPTGPDAPTNFSVMPSTTGLYLTWAASPQDPGCVTGYEIDQTTTSGGPYTVVTTVNAGTFKYNDTSAAAKTIYFYKIRAVSGTNYSPFTNEVSGK